MNIITLNLVSSAAKNIYFFIAMVIFFQFEVKAQEKITLKRATELVLENNLQVKQAQFSESISNENLKQAKFNLYPTLNASNNANFNFGRSIDPLTNQFSNEAVSSTNGSLFSSVTLFQGSQKVNQIAQNKYELEADKSYTQKVKNDLVLSVVNTYLSVLNSQDVLTAAKQQLDIISQQLEREQKFFDVGTKTLADLSQAKAQVATAELNVTNAQNQLDIAFLNLAQLLELDPNIPFEIEKPLIDEAKQVNTAYSATEVYRTALQNYPDIRLSELRTLALGKAVNVAKGNLYPRLTLQGSLGSGYSNSRQRFLGSQAAGTDTIGFVDVSKEIVLRPRFINVLEKTPFRNQIDENFNQSLGIGLSIPIFNGYSARSSIRRANINYQNAKVNEQISKNNLNKVVNQAVYDLRAAERRFYSAQTAYKSSKEAFYVIEQRYNVGLVNSLDYNQSQINLNKAQFDLIQARYDLVFRSKVIDFYLGNPLTF